MGWLVCSLLVALVLGAAPASGAGTGPGLLDALSRVPDTREVRAQPLSYVDYRAVEAARPGAARPASFMGLETLRASGDRSADVWSAAMMGVSSGSGDLTRNLYLAGEWPRRLGFDFLEVDRELAFGAPPGEGLVLLGDFDPEAIARAFAARGFEPADLGTRTIWCGPDGCDAGLAMDPADRHPGDPFGGDLGRKQPLAVSPSDLLGSTSIATVRAMVAAGDGDVPSLATDPSYRAVVEAVPRGTTLIQATFVPAATIQADMPRVFGAGSVEQVEAVLSELAASFEPIPPYGLLGITDGATEDEQVVTLALVYGGEADAAVAAEVIPRRLAAMLSLRTARALSDELRDRGVTSVHGTVVAAVEGTRAVAAITLRAPLATDDPDPDTGRFMPSSMLYRLFGDMLRSRDTLWLAPALPIPR
jgi:hypothetical protein